MFFRAGYLSILERQVEEKIHDFLVKFQAHIRGYLGRKLREKLELQHAAAHVIQRNVFQADIINNWPWWKLFQKVSCLACCKHACAYSYTCICWCMLICIYMYLLVQENIVAFTCLYMYIGVCLCVFYLLRLPFFNFLVFRSSLSCKFGRQKRRLKKKM